MGLCKVKARIRFIAEAGESSSEKLKQRLVEQDSMIVEIVAEDACEIRPTGLPRKCVEVCEIEIDHLNLY